MFQLLKMWIEAGRLTSNRVVPDFCDSEELHVTLEKFQRMELSDRKAMGQSLLIRHLDVGSNNGEEAELVALTNPYYDISRFGMDFTASPRHADVLAVTGPVTRHLKVAMERTYQAMSQPGLVVAIGDGACTGKPYTNTYACLGPVDQFLPVDIYIPGDPPSPLEILSGLLKCKGVLLGKK